MNNTRSFLHIGGCLHGQWIVLSSSAFINQAVQPAEPEMMVADWRDEMPPVRSVKIKLDSYERKTAIIHRVRVQLFVLQTLPELEALIMATNILHPQQVAETAVLHETVFAADPDDTYDWLACWSSLADALQDIRGSLKVPYDVSMFKIVRIYRSKFGQIRTEFHFTRLLATQSNFDVTKMINDHLMAQAEALLQKREKQEKERLKNP